MINFIKKIISGGQTGVDRAALDVAIFLNIPHGGWCPYGRLAEDGLISQHYRVKETPAPTIQENQDPTFIYKKRTLLNVQDSDGTLILIKQAPMAGTLYTIEMAKKFKKPYLIVNLLRQDTIDSISHWISKNNIVELNIAGPRASESSGIYELAYQFLHKALSSKLLN